MSCCHGTKPQAPDHKPSVGAMVASAVLAVNSMGLALATNLNPLTAQQMWLAHGALLLFASANMVLLGRPLVAAVWATGLRSVAGLFVLGIVGAFSFSLMSTWRGSGPVYYEVVSILLVIYSVGRALTALAQKRVLQQLHKVTLQGTLVAVRRGEGPFVDLPIEDIEPGDAFVIRPGAMIVADGEVTRGTAYVQTASLTGESQLRRVAVGDAVLASWFCTDATLTIRATRKGTERSIDGLAKSVAQNVGRSAGQRRAARALSQSERAAAVFAPIVMATACVTFLVWAYLGTWDVALLNSLAVCLVACPCAFGFAAPIGLRAGTLQLARGGLVVRDAAAFSALAQAQTVVFDKTGTLTATRIDPQQTVRFDSAMTTEQLLGLAACAQSLVHHPISDAFTPWAHLTPAHWQPMAAQLLPGCGIAATLMAQDSEHTITLGDPDQLLDASNGPATAAAAALSSAGSKPLAMLVDGTCWALFALKDSPFTPPRALVAELQQRGIKAAVLSGDSAGPVMALGLDHAQSGLTPEQKLAYVRLLQHHGKVCFVGDGINDSSALSAADVSVSMQSGSELATELSDFVLPAGKPESILSAIDVARRTTKLIRQNLIISLTYNGLGMAVAACGLLNPVAAALLMAVSSLTVSLRSLMTLRPQQGPTHPGGTSASWAAPGPVLLPQQEAP